MVVGVGGAAAAVAAVVVCSGNRHDMHRELYPTLP